MQLDRRVRCLSLLFVLCLPWQWVSESTQVHGATLPSRVLVDPSWVWTVKMRVSTDPAEGGGEKGVGSGIVTACTPVCSWRGFELKVVMETPLINLLPP